MELFYYFIYARCSFMRGIIRPPLLVRAGASEQRSGHPRGQLLGALAYTSDSIPPTLPDTISKTNTMHALALKPRRAQGEPGPGPGGADVPLRGGRWVDDACGPDLAFF